MQRRNRIAALATSAVLAFGGFRCSGPMNEGIRKPAVVGQTTLQQEGTKEEPTQIEKAKPTEEKPMEKINECGMVEGPSRARLTVEDMTELEKGKIFVEAQSIYKYSWGEFKLALMYQTGFLTPKTFDRDSRESEDGKYYIDAHLFVIPVVRVYFYVPQSEGKMLLQYHTAGTETIGDMGTTVTFEKPEERVRFERMGHKCYLNIPPQSKVGFKTAKINVKPSFITVAMDEIVYYNDGGAALRLYFKNIITNKARANLIDDVGAEWTLHYSYTK